MGGTVYGATEPALDRAVGSRPPAIRQHIGLVKALFRQATDTVCVPLPCRTRDDLSGAAHTTQDQCGVPRPGVNLAQSKVIHGSGLAGTPCHEYIWQCFVSAASLPQPA